MVAKAKRVEALRAEAEALEDEVCATVNRQWADNEVAQAKMLPGLIPLRQEPLTAAEEADFHARLGGVSK